MFFTVEILSTKMFPRGHDENYFANPSLTTKSMLMCGGFSIETNEV